MEKFTHFVVNHWSLWLALVLILALLIYEELKDKLLGLKQISPQELTQIINRDQAIVVDVRDKAAFQQGHIVGSINLVASELDANIKQLAKYQEKTLVLVDNTGQVAAAAMKLKKAGFMINSLTGGINAWKNLGFPLTKK